MDPRSADILFGQEPDRPFGGPGDDQNKSQFSTVPGAAKRVAVPDPGTSPWNGVAVINTFINGQPVRVGTGFLIAPDIILTARHNFEGVWNGLALWLGYDAQIRPAPPRPKVRAQPLRHETLDLAGLLVEPRAETVFELGAIEESPVTLAGYGYSWNGFPVFREAAGAVLTANEADLTYRINTREADSGAPVFILKDARPHAAGIHLSGAAAGQPGNFGLRFTSSVVDEVQVLVRNLRASIG